MKYLLAPLFAAMWLAGWLIAQGCDLIDRITGKGRWKR